MIYGSVESGHPGQAERFVGSGSSCRLWRDHSDRVKIPDWLAGDIFADYGLPTPIINPVFLPQVLR
jgi:hypothetical protein